MIGPPKLIAICCAHVKSGSEIAHACAQSAKALAGYSGAAAPPTPPACQAFIGARMHYYVHSATNAAAPCDAGSTDRCCGCERAGDADTIAIGSADAATDKDAAADTVANVVGAVAATD